LCDRLVDVCVDSKLDDIRKVSFVELIAPLCCKEQFREYVANVIEKGYFNFDDEVKKGLLELIAE